MCSSDFDRTDRVPAGVAPFREIRYEADDAYNGWVIPPKWDVVEAAIRATARSSTTAPGTRWR
jgi:hypothetical protein